MAGPAVIARLWRGDPPIPAEIGALEAPYDAAARRMLSADSESRDAALREWLETFPEADRATYRQGIFDAFAASEPAAGTTANAGEGVFVAYQKQLHSLADAFAPSPSIPDLVSGILPTRSLTIVYGPPGSHKTNVLLDLSLAVATGQPWLPGLPGEGFLAGYAVNQAPVLWVDVDSGQDVLKERVAAFARAYAARAETPFSWLSFPMPPIQAAKGLEDFTVFAKAHAARLIVFDNLLRIAGVQDENSSAMDGPMAALRQLAEATDAAVVVIHHRRKQVQADRAGDTMRGHSSIESAIDAGLLVSREDDIVRVKCTKARRKPIEDFAARWTFEHAEDEKTLQVARFFRAKDEGRQEAADAMLKLRILKVLRESGEPLNKSIVVEKVGGRRTTAIKALEELAEDGQAKETSGRCGAIQYSLAAAP
jgi:hypothetical protein